MFYVNYECIDGYICAVIIAHIIMWSVKMLAKGIKKLYKYNKARKEERMAANIRKMMEETNYKK